MSKSKPQYSDAKEKKWQKGKVKAEFEIAYIYTFTHTTWRWSSHCRWVEIAALLILWHGCIQCFRNGDKPGCQKDAEDIYFLVADVRWKDIAGGFEIFSWKLDVFSYRHSGSFAVQIGKSWERTFKIMRTRKRRPRLWSPFNDIWIIKTRLSKSLTSQHWQRKSQTRFQLCE